MGPTLQADVSGAGTEARDLPSPRGPPSPRPSEQSSGALAPSLLGTSSQAQVQPDAHSGALAKPLIPQTPLLYLYPHDIRRGTQMLALYRSLIFSALTLGGIQGGPLVLSCLAWGGVVLAGSPLKGSNHVEHLKAGPRCSRSRNHGVQPAPAAISMGRNSW